VPVDFFGLPEHIAACEGALADACGGERFELLADLAWMLRQRDTPRSLALVEEAEALCEQPSESVGRTRALARIDLVRAEVRFLHAELDVALSLATKARSRFEQVHDEVGVGDAYMAEAQVQYDAGMYAARQVAHEAAAQAYARSGDAMRQTLCSAWMACRASLDDSAGADSRWGDQMEGFEAVGHSAVCALVATYRGDQHFSRSEYAHALEADRRAYEHALAAGWLSKAVISALNAAAAHGSLNDLDGALAWTERASDLARPTGWVRPLATALNSLGEILRRLGRSDAAKEALQEALHVLDPLRGSQAWVVTCVYLARLLSDRNENEEALRMFVDALREADRLGLSDMRVDILVDEARTLARLGWLGQAVEAALMALAEARARHNLLRQQDALRVLAEVAGRSGMPAPPDSTAPNGAIHYREEALLVAASIDGFVIPSSELSALASEYEAVGDLARALQFERRAAQSREKTHSRDAEQLASQLHVRFQTERAKDDAEYQRRLAQTLKGANDTLQQLAAIGREITASIDAQTVFRALHRHVGRLIHAPFLAIWLLEDETPGELVLRFGIEDDSQLPEVRVPLDSARSQAARCVRERREILLEQVPGESDPALIPGTRQMPSALFAPLESAGTLRGVLSIQSDREHAYGERERQIFRALCAYGAIALANAASANRLGAIQAELEHEKLRNVLVHAGKMMTMGRLASGVLHEMAHPVGTVTVLNDTARDLLSQHRAAEAGEVLKGINRETDRLQGLIRRLQDFARSDPPVLVDVDLRAVLADAKVLFLPRLRLEQVDYEEVVDSVRVRVDPERLSLVIANIVFNALDAMADVQRKLIEVRAATQNGEVRLTLRDRGPGLSASALERLFEPFFTTKPPGKGLGLGLALSRESLTSMNGRIDAGNYRDGGAMFTMVLMAACS